TPGGWSWYLKDDSSHGAGLYSDPDTINNGQWHHLVHVFVRGANGTTYLDGVLVDVTSIASIGNIDTPGPINIGQDPTGLYVETGSRDLDDMGVWRRALTQSEAAQIYGAGQNAGRSFDTYGPVTITLGKVGSDHVIIWQAGTLLQADSLTGPWTTVSGA